MVIQVAMMQVSPLKSCKLRKLSLLKSCKWIFYEKDKTEMYLS